MSLRKALERVLAHEPSEFLAPVPDAQAVRLFSLQNGIPYWFELRNPEPGWWYVVPETESDARLGNRAMPYEKLDYLIQLPRFYVITAFRITHHTWLVVPFNPSDAAQRGWKNNYPRQMHLVRHDLDPHQIVEARDMAGCLLYGNIALRFDAPLSQHALIQNLVDERNKEIERRRIEQERLAKMQTLEGQMQLRLDFMGARLESWQEIGDGYEVKWSFNGVTHTATIARNLRIEAAGVCMQGTEQRHNLTSIVAVMEEARRLHRYDMDEKLWL